jgi:hypothetical protein
MCPEVDGSQQRWLVWVGGGYGFFSVTPHKGNLDFPAVTFNILQAYILTMYALKQ